MVNSSPARRSYNYVASSPLSDILYTDRNSEARHKQMLEASRREHERVHQLAMEALENHRREEERRQILELERREQERIRKEKELAAERKRLHELQAQKVEIPPEPPKPEPAPSVSPPGAFGAKPPTTSKSTASAAAAATTSTFGSKPPSTASQASAGPPAQAAATKSVSKPATQPAPAAPSTLFGQAPSKPAAPQQPAAAASPFAKASPFAAAQQKTSSPFPQAQAPAATAPSALTAAGAKQATTSQLNGKTGPQAPAKAASRGPDRYEVIHKNLKDLRRLMMDQAMQNPALKNRMGDMRREIRKYVGQLTNGAGAKGNSVQVRRNSCVSPYSF